MFTVEFPYDIGTFVQVNDMNESRPPEPKQCWDDLSDIGVISAYTSVIPCKNGPSFEVIVSGYKQYWWGRYPLSGIRLLTDSEISKVEESLSTKEEEIYYVK